MSELSPILTRALAAGRADRPASDRGKERTLAALGLGTTAVATSASAAGTAGARRMLGWPWLSVILAFVAVDGARLVYQAAPSAEQAPIVAPSAAPARATEPSPPREALEPPIATLAVSDLPNAPALVGRERRVRPGAPDEGVAATDVPCPSCAPQPEIDSLHDELIALGRASRALSERRCSSARSALSAYRSKFPAGKLEREADVVDIEIIGRSGDVERARSAARSFVQRFPNSPYALRLGPWLRADGPTLPTCVDDVP